MRHIFRVAALLSLTFMVSCSSSPKKDQTAEDKGAVDATSSDGSGAEKGSVEAAETGGQTSEEPPGGPATMNAKGEKKYAALAQALRAGKANGILDEAGKILSTNQHDVIALNTLALYHLRKNHVGAAKLLINRAFEKNQNSAALYNNLGVVMLDEGDQQAALNNFKKALRIDDKHPQALANLGSLYVQAGDYTKALPLLEQAYKQLHASNPAVANNYGIALRGNKDLEGAKRVYEEVLKQNSRDIGTLLNYAVLLIDFMNKPKDGLALVYKVKFLETDKRDILDRANALEKKAKAGLK